MCFLFNYLFNLPFTPVHCNAETMRNFFVTGTAGEVKETNTDLGISILCSNQKGEIENSKEDTISGNFKFEVAEKFRLVKSHISNFLGAC